MTTDKKDYTPKKFVGLHAHSTVGSIGDAIGFPQDHIDYAIENGEDALALTDHGNMNGFSHQYFHWENLKKKGVNFKAIPGIEAYFIDNLQEWQKLNERSKEQKRQEKAAKEAEKLKKQPSETSGELDIVGDEFADVKAELTEQYKKDEDEEGDSVVENEKETKTYQKFSDPLKQRNHLVLLPKNREGLYSLFKLTSESFINGYYKYPRIDFKQLEKYANGNLIASSACISGDSLLPTSQGLIAIKDVVERLAKNEELFVLSYNEVANKLQFKEIVWGQKTKTNAKVYKVKLANGKEIKGTPDHKVFTNKGWIRIDELKKNMPLSILTTDA